MPLDLIKKWYFNSELKKNVQREASLSSVGVMVSMSNNFEEIENLKKIIRNSGHKDDIHILCFINSKDLPPILPKCEFYTLKDIKWAGYPKNNDVDKFIKRNYKNFYYLSSTFTQHEHFILHNIKAEKKWGIHHNGIETYIKFMVDVIFKSAVDTYKEIQLQLQNLQINDSK